jgi:hypothetical protein
VVTTNKCTSFAGHFDGYADAVVQCGVHRLMEHLSGFTGSHWIPPLGKFLCRIASTAAMVDKFTVKHQNTNKTQLLASN